MTLSLDGKRLLVLGGTGSLGGHMVRRLLGMSPGLVRVFSRDEKKQLDMRRSLGERPNLEFVIGDVRNRRRVREALHGIDIAMNAAALKHIPVCEEAPTEAILTNLTGAINLRTEALSVGVDTVISISTDKAVKPTNVLGMTKALMERVVLATTPVDCGTRFLCVRYGNVFGSRGSVVPVFVECVAEGRALPVTDTAMTRFILTLDEAVDSMFAALEVGRPGEIWVRRCPAVRILDLGRAIAFGLRNDRSYPIEPIGIRRGEKLHETLVSTEEVEITRTYGGYFRISAGHTDESDDKPDFIEYSSQDERMLDEGEILGLLKTGGWLPGSR